MSDLVDRLRDHGLFDKPQRMAMFMEAAERIEQLETLLQAPTKEEIALYARIKQLEAALPEIGRLNIPAHMHWLGDEALTPPKNDVRGCVLYFDNEDDCLEFQQQLIAYAAIVKGEG